MPAMENALHRREPVNMSQGSDDRHHVSPDHASIQAHRTCRSLESSQRWDGTFSKYIPCFAENT